MADVTCLERRAWLHAANMTPDKLKTAGRSMIEAGFLSDAVDFLAKAGDREGLARVIEIVIGEGDVFLFTRALKALGRQATEAEWDQLEQTAVRLGKQAFAARAAEMRAAG